MKRNNRILLVCDDETARGLYLQSLADISHNVEFVDDADDALEAIDRQPYDLVLLDVHISAVPLLRTIKEKTPNSEVVVIADSPKLAAAKEAVGFGAFDYVGKPLGPQDVVRISGAALAHKGWVCMREQKPWMNQAGCSSLPPIRR